MSEQDERQGLSRRDVLKGSAALALTATGLQAGLGRPAMAAEPVVRGYGVTTSQLKDWEVMRKAIGVKMEFTPTNADIGVFMRDVISNDLGETHDIFIFDGGTEDVLGPQGYYAEIVEDHKELTNWKRTPDSWKRSDLIRAGGKQYGVPVIGNGDSFGYFPAKLGVNPNGMDDVSWAAMYEWDKTKGRVSIDRSWLLSMTEIANYLNHHGKVKVKDPSDMTGEEAKAVALYAAERKKAGQFRTLHAAFEEQVQLLSNKEVDVINCWEPATKETNNTLGPNSVVYAFTVEGYYKWGHGAYVHAKAMKRDNVDAIYKVLNYYLGGEYRALQARDRGYAGPNMDLGVEYAEKNSWPKEQVENLKWTDTKVSKKFEKPFFGKPAAPNAAIMEEEWQRFLNA